METIAKDNYTNLVDELTYGCYRYNRIRSPEITPEKWTRVFGNTDLLEKRFQQEGGSL